MEHQNPGATATTTSSVRVVTKVQLVITLAENAVQRFPCHSRNC